MQENTIQDELHCDVAVIGGGPAGMMAAIFAARDGAKVILVEKNKTLGKKLLITGGGRCNITNAIFDNRELAKKYGAKGKFLLSPFSKWSAQDTIDFFEEHETPIKIEAENRVFPKSNSSQSVLDTLTEQLEELNVQILTDAPVVKLVSVKNKILRAETPKATIIAQAFIITTGGTARPETGSSGDGFKWLNKLGHTISTPSVALVPITTKEEWSHKLSGLSLPNVKVTLVDGAVRSKPRLGKILFTHFGLSGPLILNMSQTIKESLNNLAIQTGAPTTLELDLFPTLDTSVLDEKLREHLSGVQNKKWSNALVGFVPPLLIPHLVEISEINHGTLVNKISRVQRLAFVNKLKTLTITPTGLLGIEKAIVSSGGVALEEVDFKTMRSQKIENLYLAGDILDFDRPSGGFSLQICWSTGFVAGTSSAESLKSLE